MWAINLLTILCLSTRTRTEMMLSGDTLINASQQQQHRLQDVNHGSWHTFDNDAGCSSFNRFNCPGSRPSVWTLSSYDVDNTWHLLLWPLEREIVILINWNLPIPVRIAKTSFDPTPQLSLFFTCSRRQEKFYKGHAAKNPWRIIPGLGKNIFILTSTSLKVSRNITVP